MELATATSEPRTLWLRRVKRVDSCGRLRGQVQRFWCQRFMPSERLLKQREKLLTQQWQIEASGKIAPEGVWESIEEVKNGDRSFPCAVCWWEEHGAQRGKSIGAPYGKKHQAIQQAIKRRDQLTLIRKQLKLIDKMLRAQLASESLLSELREFNRRLP